MSWRAILPVLLLIVCCRAETVKWCNGDMWSEPQAVFVGDTFEVFCRCNTSRVRLQDMHLTPSDLQHKWETTAVDEFTVMHEERVDYGRKHIRIFCMHGNDLLGELYVKVVPLLHVTDFECRIPSFDKKAKCSFKELGFAASIPKKSYSLSVGGLQSIPCWNAAHYSDLIECPGLYIPRDSTSDYQIQLSMEYEGYNQSQIFPMTLRKMSVPEWPSFQPKINQGNLRICLKWAHTDHSSPLAIPQNWRVIILAGNSKIQPLYIEIYVIPMLFKDICLPKLPYANQVYKFHFRRRYNVTDAPWSTYFETNEFISAPAFPARPPELLPNGFYHDPEKKELYVFWQQLYELELNGPNFTYAAITSSGKNASSIDSNCALFSDWDLTLPSFIYVWSRNSAGSSTTSTRLEVPVLTSSRSHLPLELRYHDDNYTLTWQAPREQDGLTGYAISWCSGSTNRLQICDDLESIVIKMVERSRLYFPFNHSMVLSNMAVAATYKDKPSGGMRWIGPKFPSVHKLEQMSTGLGLVQVIAVIIIVVSLLALTFVSFRKLRQMAKIDVSLPEILFNSLDIEISVSAAPVSIAVPGNFSPNGVLTIDILTSQSAVEKEVEVLPDWDSVSEPRTPASNSRSSSEEDLATETEPETKSGPNPVLGTGYVMSPV